MDANDNEDNTNAFDGAYEHRYNTGFETSTIYATGYHNGLADGCGAPLFSDNNCEESDYGYTNDNNSNYDVDNSESNYTYKW